MTNNIWCFVLRSLCFVLCTSFFVLCSLRSALSAQLLPLCSYLFALTPLPLPRCPSLAASRRVRDVGCRQPNRRKSGPERLSAWGQLHFPEECVPPRPVRSRRPTSVA